MAVVMRDRYLLAPHAIPAKTEALALLPSVIVYIILAVLLLAPHNPARPAS